MESASVWLHHTVAHRVRRRSVREALLGALGAGLLGARLGGPVIAVGGALVIGLALWWGRPALALRLGPLSPSSLRSFLVAPPRLARGVGGPSDHPVSQWLAEHRFRFEGVVEDGSELGAVDLHAAQSQRVAVVVGRVTGSVLVLSRLADGHLLATARTITPPTRGLIAQACADLDDEALVLRHLALLDRAVQDGRGPVACSATDLLVGWVHLERAGWAALDPRAAAVLDLTGRAPWTRLAVRIDAAELLERSWPVGPPMAPVPTTAPGAPRTEAVSPGGVAPVAVR